MNLQEFKLAGFSFLHDFVLTQNYYVIFQNPVSVNSLGYMLGATASAGSVRWQGDKRPMLIHAIPRAQGVDWEGCPARHIVIEVGAARLRWVLFMRWGDLLTDVLCTGSPPHWHSRAVTSSLAAGAALVDSW